MKKYNKQVH